MISIFKKLRVTEAALMTGFVMISIPFTGGERNAIQFESCTLLLLGTMALLLSIYSINSFYGFHYDQSNSRFIDKQLKNRAIYLLTATLSLAASAVLLGQLDKMLVALAAVNFAIWAIYSGPNGAKGRPIAGTAVHFLAQISLFQFGFITFSHISISSILISLFFAFLFASGHIIHELKDYGPDRRTLINTNAVNFGPKRMIWFYRRMVICVLLYWILLYLLGVIALGLFVPFVVAGVAHALMSLLWRPEDFLTTEGNRRFQVFYRAQYFCAGILSFLISSGK